MKFSFHLLLVILFSPIWITALLILIFGLIILFNRISESAPAATLIAVSLALDLPPPL